MVPPEPLVAMAQAWPVPLPPVAVKACEARGASPATPGVIPRSPPTEMARVAVLPRASVTWTTSVVSPAGPAT